MSIPSKALFVVFCCASLLSGCKTTEPMYYYGNYSEAVYSYFKADETPLGQQINILEEIIAQARGQVKPVAPGIHAHLAMLYLESGNNDQGMSHFEQEKMLFPESAGYIDFLMSKAAGKNI